MRIHLGLALYLLLQPVPVAPLLHAIAQLIYSFRILPAAPSRLELSVPETRIRFGLPAEVHLQLFTAKDEPVSREGVLWILMRV